MELGNDQPLKRGTLNCPGSACKKPMHFEVIGGVMRVVRDGFLHARCPSCKTEYRVVPNGD